MSVTITTFGSPTDDIDDLYTLKCYVRGTMDATSYQWFGPPNGEPITNSSSRMVLSNSSLTLLKFSLLLTSSHAGVYTCRATVNGVVAENSIIVTVNGQYIYIYILLLYHTINFISFVDRIINYSYLFLNL